MVKLEFGIVGFWGEGKTGVLEEKGLGAKERTNNKLNPHMALTPGFEPGPQWWEAIQALSPLRHSLLPFLNATANPSLFILLMINNYISFVEKTNLIKSLLSSSCQLLSQRFISPVPINWRNIVGQWMLHVTSICTPCCMLLRTRVVGTGVFAQSLKPVKLSLKFVIAEA